MIEFDWDAENILHIARHNVTTDEVEYVLTHPTVDLRYQDWHDEERFIEVGTTQSGRSLLVATTSRDDKTRVATAYDPPPFVVREYFKRKVS